MPISAPFLALKIAYLAKDANKNRFTISEQKLKLLAHRAVLTIPYLHQLKLSLEEFGYFLGSLKGGYGLFAINSLEGAPSLPNHLSNKELLETFTEAELYSKLSNSLPSSPTENDQASEEQPLAILVFELLIKIIKKNNEQKKHKTTTPGELAKKLKGLGHTLHHKKLEAPLIKIENYCIQREKMLTPNIKYLVVKGRPDSAIKIDENMPKELKIIYSHSWDEEFELFKQYIEKSDPGIARPNKKPSFMSELANPTENKLTPTPEAHPDVAVPNSEKSVTNHAPNDINKTSEQQEKSKQDQNDEKIVTYTAPSDLIDDNSQTNKSIASVKLGKNYTFISNNSITNPLTETLEKMQKEREQFSQQIKEKMFNPISIDKK